jgi:uncharacterized membrane protein
MDKRILFNVVMNLILVVIFISLNQWALQNQLEETFVALALFYGCTIIVGNALFISLSRTA